MLTGFVLHDEGRTLPLDSATVISEASGGEAIRPFLEIRWS